MEKPGDSEHRYSEASPLLPGDCELLEARLGLCSLSDPPPRPPAELKPLCLLVEELQFVDCCHTPERL